MNGRKNKRRNGGTGETASGLEGLRREKRPMKSNKYFRSTYSVPGTGPVAQGHRDEQDRAVTSRSSPHPKLQLPREGLDALRLH